MQTYKNTKYVKRNYDCTNVVACQCDDKSKIRYAENYAQCDESITEKLTQLWIENDVRYFGYL